MKKELSRITKEKYQPLIKVLKEYGTESYSDNDHLPSHHDIAKILNYKVARTCKLLKDLHSELTDDFMSTPVEVNDYVHEIHIAFPWDEHYKLKEVDKKHPFLEEYTWVTMKLPYTPRIGEEISLDFLYLKYFTRGHVHRVQHQIDGIQQKIYLEVHPLDHEYYRWKKLEEDYEYRERRKKHY